MTTATTTPGTRTWTSPARPPAAASAGVPLARLVRVELRKLVDTRAGRWLLIALGLVTLASVALVALATPAEERTMRTFVTATASPQGFLLPVLGILLVTSEWSQRTALVTFALEPRRGRVLLAKVLASCVACVVAIVVAFGLAALATLALGSADRWQGTGAALFANFAVLQLSSVLQGLAFGLVFLASSPAIVSYFVLPTAFTLVATFWTAMEKVQPWVDLGFAQLPLFEADPLRAAQWWHLAATSGQWIALPFVLGAVRLLRAEVK